MEQRICIHPAEITDRQDSIEPVTEENLSEIVDLMRHLSLNTDDLDYESAISECERIMAICNALALRCLKFIGNCDDEKLCHYVSDFLRLIISKRVEVQQIRISIINAARLYNVN